VPFGLCCRSLLIVCYNRNGHATADVAARRAAAPGTGTSAPHRRWTCWPHSAFRRAMLTKYQHTSPGQPTDPKFTDALLTWEVTAA
jgi:hypothetical protein